MKNMTALLVLVAFAALFGCIGGGGNGGTPTATPVHTATPAVTATPAGSGTPIATPTPGLEATATPEGSGLSYEDVTGCSHVGISFAYRITTDGGVIEQSYEMSEGGTVNGVDTVLKTMTMDMAEEDMEIVMKEWDSKVGCRCVKMETQMMGQTIPSQCPSPNQGGSVAAGDDTTITEVGVENVSVPAYTGLAMKTNIVTAGQNGTYTVWNAPGIAMPVKTEAPGMTMELLRYSS